jgi:hypothetical protein
MFAAAFTYIRTNITTCSMTQSQCPVFLFFKIYYLIFKNSDVLVINRVQCLILVEGEIT